MFDYLLERGILSKKPILMPADVEAEFFSIPYFEVNPPPKKRLPFTRHKDVWCYEHNRYQSPHDPNFWIDASVYPAGFIATMGPLDGTDFEGAADTRPHFWQMVHETKSRVIVMTTDLKEGPKLKCAQYWPDEEETYGKHTVLKKNEKRQDRLHIRELQVDDHALTHIHILNWPDNGAFSCLENLENAVDEASRRCENAPIIVHCSAGVGRTGSFISCYLIKKARSLGLYVNLPKLIHFLRKEGRVRSVEGLDQYKMIYAFAKKIESNITGA